MSNILLCHTNRADDATLSGPAYHATWVLNNLKDDDIDKPARTTSATRPNTRFRLDLTTIRSLRALALRKNNFSRACGWRVRLGNSPFDVDFTNAGVLDERITASGGANGQAFGADGLLAAATTPRFEHDPLYFENGFRHSEDMTQSVWVANAAGSLFGHAIDAKTVALPSGVQWVQQLGHAALVAGVSYVVSGKVRLVSGNGDFAFRINDGTTPTAGPTQTATSVARRFNAVLVAAGTSTTSGFAGLRKETAEGVLEFSEMQIRRATSIGRYVKTGASRAFTCRGILVEEGRTNLHVRNCEFDNASWTKGSVSITANQRIAPDGATAMDLMTHTANGGVTQATAAFTAGSTLTISVFVAIGSVNFLRIDAGGLPSAWFNIATGTKGTRTAGSGNILSLDHDMKYVGNGIWRCWLSVTTTTITTFNITYSATAADSGPAANTNTIYLWGSQPEVGGQPTSHIPTAGATVARTADTLTVTGSNFTDNFSSTAGTIYAEWIVPPDAGASAVSNMALGLNDTTANERIELYSRTLDAPDHKCVAAVVDGGANQASFVGATVTTGSIVRASLTYRTNLVQAAFDGVAGALDSAATMPTLTRAQLGFNSAGTYLNSVLRRVTSWLFNQTDAQQLAITTSGPGAIGYESDWLNVLQFDPDADLPSDWARKYDAFVAFNEISVRYGTIEIDDTANADGYVEMGRLFVGGGFQPRRNASFQGMGDGRADLSTIETLPESGKEYGTERVRQRWADFTFHWLTQEEANYWDLVRAEVGLIDEVLYIRDPADMGLSQQWSGLGKLRELSAIEYPYVLTRAVPVRWKEKL